MGIIAVLWIGEDTVWLCMVIIITKPWLRVRTLTEVSPLKVIK